MADSDALNRYRVISRIGAGGMATVDLAEDTVLGRRVALKQVSGDADVRNLSRLRREALVGASVSHPNLVSVYDVVNTDDGHLVIVMEYVEGETLRQLLRRQGRLDSAEALRILAGVAAGLDAINERGIVHRDVKPSNVLLGAGGAVKLADLGIASVPDRTRITTSGSILGSLSYMAPEQLSDAPVTPAIDVYALAAVTFEVLSGVKARREPHAVALAHAISTQGPPSLQEAWPRAPRALDDLLQRGMARNPRERPRSAGELIARTRAVLVPEDTVQVTAPRVAPTALPTTAVAPAVVAPRAVPPAVVSPRAVSPRAVSPAVAPRDPTGGRRRWGRAPALAAALLILAAAGAAVIVLTAGGSPAGGTADKAASGDHSQRGRTRPRASTSTSAGVPTSTSAGVPTSTSAGVSTSTSAGVSTSTAAAGVAPAGDPVSAVKSFYTLAAAHRYPQAWALADPSMQAQLGGYRSFQSDQAGDRSITFTSTRTVSQTATGARVAITTTSVRSNGTQHCSGTVDLVPGAQGGRWQLHQIGINCS